jgi:2-polyprenyl-6-methoxyphenol hydroxylase-like FAD-dependent oxidoreductase
VRIACVGGGPAGLYLALMTRLCSPAHEVTVMERNPPGTALGWGVTWGEEFLDDVYAADPVSGRRLRAAALVWGDQVVRITGRDPVHIGGRYGYCISRSRMVDILTKRALELGAKIEYERAVEDPGSVDADLVVAADGVASRLRAARASTFRPTVTTGRNRYVWLGTPKVFDAFTFAFERTDAGWVWAYGYPSSGETSTFIVECSPETWSALGLSTLPHDEGLRLVAGVFAGILDGQPLLDPPAGPSPWLQFREIRNATWRAGNLVLAGDAAHTTHFGIGSGTVLAVQDAIALADALRGVSAAGGGLDTALAAYDRHRRGLLSPIQGSAMRSMRWFEDVDRHLAADPVRVAWSLFDRRRDQAPWRYQLHLATQVEPLRQARRRITTARRTVRERMRERSVINGE